MDAKKSKKLRALVYVGLAGGLVGVSNYSAAAHGNAYSNNTNGAEITWQADEFQVVQQNDQVKATADAK